MNWREAIASLAQISTEDSSKIIIGCIVLIGLVLVFFFVSSWIRRRLTVPDDLPSGGFTLGDIRQLHREGKMTNEEFEKARALIVVAAKRAAERDMPANKDGKSNPGDIKPR